MPWGKQLSRSAIGGPLQSKKRGRLSSAIINARAETVAVKPMFCQSFSARRCLIPASGFYEWQTTNVGKQPMFIHPVDGGLVAFAGIWQTAKQEESVVLLTTEANLLVEPIHKRMPVILTPEQHQVWLDMASEAKTLMALCKPYGGKLEFHAVAKSINRSGEDNPAMIVPITPAKGNEQMTLW